VSFDDAFARYERSPWLRTRFQEVFDAALPAEVEPFSFVPLDGLRELSTVLALEPDDLLVDLACGRGGPGMWLARAAGARLAGVDGSAVAVAQAAARVGAFGLDGRATFTTGDLAATGLPDGCAHGAVCVDAFQFAPDPVACAREVLRVLRPGGRFALTTWEPRRAGDRKVPERFRRLDAARALATAGFAGVEVVERPGWEVRREAVYEAALAGDATTDDGLALLQMEARKALPRQDRLRRVRAVGRRPG